MNRRTKRITIFFIELFIIIAIIGFLVAAVIWGGKTIYYSFVGEQSVISQSEKEASDIVQSEAENDKWILILVNRDNPLPEGYQINLVETENGHIVDERIKEPLERMLADARSEGMIPKITSSYRTKEEQQALLYEKTREYINQGMNESYAAIKAAEWVALPGTSEHETGLAIDISTADWEQQNAYLIWEWLAENCYKYGFILRYTEEKQHITGIIPEPWHFRYVGITAASEIMESKICLEEYLNP